MFTEYNEYDNPHDKLEKMPLYIKGREILDLVRTIADLIADEDEKLGWIKQLMLTRSRYFAEPETERCILLNNLVVQNRNVSLF